jgi:hypothetical protein
MNIANQMHHSVPLDALKDEGDLRNNGYEISKESKLLVSDQYYDWDNM